MDHKDIPQTHRVGQLGLGGGKLARIHIIHHVHAERVRIKAVHRRVCPKIAMEQEGFEGRRIRVELWCRFLRNEQGIGQGGSRLLEDRSIQGCSICLYCRIQIEEGRAPAIMRKLHLANEFRSNLAVRQVCLCRCSIAVLHKLLRTHAHPDTKAGVMNRLEVRVIQLHPAVGRAGALNHTLHLRCRRADLVRGAHITCLLRILLAFDVPRDHTLRVQMLEIGHCRSRLSEHPLLELGQTGSVGHIEVARLSIVEISSWIIRVASWL